MPVCKIQEKTKGKYEDETLGDNFESGQRINKSQDAVRLRSLLNRCSKLDFCYIAFG